MARGPNSRGSVIGFVVPIEYRQQLEAVAEASGLNMSELMRAIVINYFAGPAFGEYLAARQLAVHMAKRLLQDAIERFPATLDQALAEGLLPVHESDEIQG